MSAVRFVRSLGARVLTLAHPIPHGHGGLIVVMQTAHFTKLMKSTLR